MDKIEIIINDDLSPLGEITAQLPLSDDESKCKICGAVKPCGVKLKHGKNSCWYCNNPY